MTISTLRLLSITCSFFFSSLVFGQATYEKLIADLKVPVVEENIIILIPEMSCIACIHKQMKAFEDEFGHSIFSNTVIVSNRKDLPEMDIEQLSDPQGLLDRTLLLIGNITFCRVKKADNIFCFPIETLDSPLLKKSDLKY